jgi:hypothetical protein
MPLEREDLEFYTQIIRDDIRGVNERLDTLNINTTQNTIDIALLKSNEDTSGKANRNQSIRWSAGTGSFVGGIIIAIYQLLKS